MQRSDQQARGGEATIRVERVALHLVDLPLVNRFRTAYGTTTSTRR